MPIHFFEEDIEYSLPNKTIINNWLTTIAENHKHSIEELNYIYCNDNYLLSLNQEYLDHDTLTDIITFDNSDSPNIIEGEIYISIERVQENAELFAKSFEEELNRVMAHGLLHLLGYKDKSEDEQLMMRKKEEACLSLLANLR